jgi:hypothetical protein
VFGESESEISLVIVTPALALIDESASLVAVTWTAEVFVVFETDAENERLSPSNTDPEPGVMLAVMEGGAGDERATEPAPPPPQPRVHALIARRVAAHACSQSADESVFHKVFSLRICGRGRIPHIALQSPRLSLTLIASIELLPRFRSRRKAYRSNWLQLVSIFCNCVLPFFPRSKTESPIPKQIFRSLDSSLGAPIRKIMPVASSLNRNSLHAV